MRRSPRRAAEARRHGEARDREWLCGWLVLASVMLWVSHPIAQQLLDRVFARVDGYPITLTDVQAAIGLGVIQVPQGSDPIAAGTQQMIDRQLELTEVQRFPPPERHLARRGVANEHRRATVEQWIRDLRSRADVAVNK